MSTKDNGPLQLVGIPTRLVLCEDLDAPHTLTVSRLFVDTSNGTAVACTCNVEVAI